MRWMQAITLIKSHARFYRSTLEAAGYKPSVLSLGLECAVLPLKPCVCVRFVRVEFNSLSIVCLLMHVPDVHRGRAEEIDGER